MKRLISFLRNKLFTQSPRPETEEVAAYLWIFSFLPVLLTLAFSFHLQKWYWGLMDDACILGASTHAMGRFWVWFTGLLGLGEFRPLSALHAGVLYSIFEKRPDWLYIFKVFEVLVILLIWGLAAYRFTKKKISYFLVAAITLSFHYFYDAFFYLSSSEIIGLLFLGIAVNFLITNLESILGSNFEAGSQVKPKFSPWSALAGIFFLLCAFGSKETFTSSAVSLGFLYMFLGFKNWKRSNVRFTLAVFGLLLIIGSLSYGSFLFNSVRTGFTSSYSFTPAKYLPNINSWLRKDLINHSPWIFGIFLLWVLTRIESPRRGFRIQFKVISGVLLGLLFYFLYLFLLLPWFTTCQYATPLGLFFAFSVTVLASDLLSRINIKFQIPIIICALALNLFVAHYALNREAAYQYDTANLMCWIKDNPRIFNPDIDFHFVKCNAQEPSEVISRLVNRKFGLRLKKFKFTRFIELELQDPRCGYFLYSPRFSPSIDREKLKDWVTVFYSRNWIVFKKINE